MPDQRREADMDEGGLAEVARRLQHVEQTQQRQVNPELVINAYRQKCADLDFELIKHQALLAEVEAERDALAAEVANLRAMHAPETLETGG